MHFGFSYIGLSFLIMLTVPNLLWAKNRPKAYETYVVHENRFLLLCERIGEIAVTGISLLFSDFNIYGVSPWLLWLLAAFVLMLLYEAYWIRYFHSEKTMRDFYRNFIGIPVAGATLPVLAFLLLGIYGKNVLLLAAVAVLGIGHIGIHLQHKKELE